MKTSIACAVLLVLSCTIWLSAQQPAAQAPAASGTRVAVIDISRVFKNHPRFNAEMETMKADVQQFDADLRSRAAAVEKLQTETKEWQPGTAQYKELEQKILKQQADINISATQKKKEFLEREAAIYHSVYNEIVKEVSEFAQRHGIAMVVRFTSDPIDPNNRQSVLEGVNRPVVFQTRSDITNQIIRKFNPGAGQTAARPAGNTSGSTQ